jgi:WD40 repeat protein
MSPTRRTGPLGEPLQGHTDTVDSVAFSPDGHTLASGGCYCLSFIVRQPD